MFLNWCLLILVFHCIFASLMYGNPLIFPEVSVNIIIIALNITHRPLG